MSKAKFAAVKELIDEKKFDEARTLLKTIDNPVAQEWIDKINKLSPPPIASKSSPKATTYIYNLVRGFLVIVLAMVVLLIVIAQFNRTSSEINESGKNVVAALSTVNSQPPLDPTKPLLIVSTATSAGPTAVPPSATATETLAPSSTITNTPIPSATPTLTVTPTATITPSSTNAPFGLKGNPYPLGAPGNVRDGRMQVNQFARNQTAVLKQINQFNDDPPAGGEWVISNITFYCDLSPDETCNVSLMDLEITGKQGNIYKRPSFVTMDNQFRGEVFGGGQLTGSVAFTVNSSDSSFIFIVNDAGNRTFFTAGG